MALLSTEIFNQKLRKSIFEISISMLSLYYLLPKPKIALREREITQGDEEFKMIIINKYFFL